MATSVSSSISDIQKCILHLKPMHMITSDTTRRKNDPPNFPPPHAMRLHPTPPNPLTTKTATSGAVAGRPMLRPPFSSHPDYAAPARAARLRPPPSTKYTKLRAPKVASAQAQMDAGGTTYFYSRDQQPVYTPESGMYSKPPAHVARSSKGEGFFTPEDLRQELLQRQAVCLSQPADGACPPEIDHYHSLCPLESIDTTSPEQKTQRTFGHACTCYRATSSKDGLYYCLRRIHQLRLTSGKTVLELEKWRKLQHNNLVTLREMFTTKAFGDNSVVFVHDYHAGAESMATRHLHGSWRAGHLPEDLVWDYVIQLVSALRLVHSSGLALRCIDATKVLLTGHRSARLCVNCAGVMDILTFNGSGVSSHSTTLHQQEDLAALGELLMCVALQSPLATKPENFLGSMEALAAHYSPEIHHILQYLVHSGSKGPPHNIVDVLPMIGGRVYASLERAHLHQDRLEAELGKELQNGRLFRLLAKLGTITDRPELTGDEQWSQTGDRYLLKLFQDYLFHQVLPSGAPWVDLAHVVQTLNKLDAGSQENVMLHSRDEQSVLLVSFSDLKACLETTFSEVLASNK